MKLITMCNTKHAQGVYALINSLVQNSNLGNIDVLCLVYEELTEKWRERISQLAKVEYQDVRDLGEVKLSVNIPEKRLLPSLQKLLVFKIPYAGKMAWFDTDIICLNDISVIEQFDHFTACMRLGAEHTYMNNYRPEFNAGFFVFRSGMYDEIIDHARTMNCELPLADQDILNSYFYTKYPEQVNLLDYRFSTTKKLKRLPRTWNVRWSNLLHYVGTKPWDAHQGKLLQDIWDKYKYKGS